MSSQALLEEQKGKFQNANWKGRKGRSAFQSQGQACFYLFIESLRSPSGAVELLVDCVDYVQCFQFL
jgi:hypothetical protein